MAGAGSATAQLTTPRGGPRGAGPVVAINSHASGIGDPDRLLETVLAQLVEAGASGAGGTVTRSADELGELIRGAPDRRIVLVGGDGGVHAALNAATGPLELALVPAGRANNIAAALGLPARRADAVRLAATGRARPIDAIRVETGGRTLYGVEGVSAGFQADARGRYTHESSGALLAGAGALLGALGRYRPFDARVVADGRVLHDGPAAQLFVASFPLFGFGFQVAPGADPGDGRLDVVVARAGSRRRLVRLLAAAYRGTHLELDGVERVRAREVRIERPLPLVCDSESLGVKTAAIGIETGRLRIVR